MFFHLCPVFPIKQNIQFRINYTKLYVLITLLPSGVQRAPHAPAFPPCPNPPHRADSRPILETRQNMPKRLAAGAESHHIHFRKTGGHIYRQSGQGREAATVTNFDMGRSVFHLSLLTAPLPLTFICSRLQRNKIVDENYGICFYIYVLTNRGI